MIAERIQSHKYHDLDDLVKDLHLMISNAKTFNEPGSQVYKVCSRRQKEKITDSFFSIKCQYVLLD